MDEVKLRSIKNSVEENSKVIERIVDQIISRYARDLDLFVEEIKETLQNKNQLTDEELENITIKLPVFMYFAASGLEKLGIEGDNAKAYRLQIFNDAYLLAEGTIQDKTKVAELKTFSEHLIEVSFGRAYKKLRVQLDMAEHLFSGIKKVLSKRMQETELSKKEY